MFNEGFRGGRADQYCIKIDVDRPNNCIYATVFDLDGYVRAPKERNSFKFQSTRNFLENIQQYHLNPGHVDCLKEDVWIAKECLLAGARFEQGEKPEQYLWMHAC